jgi:hypothetical protein
MTYPNATTSNLSPVPPPWGRGGRVAALSLGFARN